MFGGFFGGGGGGGMFNDPFFNDMHQRMNSQMRQMDQLMNNMMGGGAMGPDPFGPMLMPPHMQQPPRYHGPQNPGSSRGTQQQRQQMIDDEYGAQAQHQMAPHNPMMMNPFGGLLGGGLFGNIGNMMQQMRDQAENDPNSHVYSHSTVISYDGLSGDQPRYYEASNSTRKAGQVKEVRRSVRDSATGEEKMEIGHHIGDRGHVIEKRRVRQGHMEEKQKYVNIQPDQAHDFDREWRHATHSHGYALGNGGRRQPGGQYRHRAIDSHRPYASNHHGGAASGTSATADPVPIVEEPDDPQPSRPSNGQKRKRRDGPQIYEI